MVLHKEFRDGNVPAGYENLRILKEALDHLPGGDRKAFSVIGYSGLPA